MIFVRKFILMDLKRVYEIECKSFKDPYHIMFLLNLNEAYPDTFLVAEKNGFVIGYIISRRINNKGHIIAIAVDPMARGMGIGKALIEATTRVLRASGIIEVYLEVRISNLQAIRFYESMGFNKELLLNSYYADGEDGILLKKSIIIPTVIP